MFSLFSKYFYSIFFSSSVIPYVLEICLEDFTVALPTIDPAPILGIGSYLL